ncbi:glycosyltransferase family 2 protein [Pseudomarimonas arenosa]|uniref:Glycosyltransferase family 2 protein n=1 Tax=Pseudomarimonas arenosa TaxID=2774145 RepID=A0AAW3ZJL6_9GAMM|nr:glycosyltransferase family 2 protein [Pseudomarimonas arenosa]MBD8525414.1 glycosyltransferase family 2 protein [Pseudomarimonas arenosa]
MIDSTAILIPALNEALRIREVVQGALQHCPRVIVVDDGSTDGTCDEIEDLPITLIRHSERRGKGEGLRTGFRAALELGVQGVLTMDGDGQHLASDIPRLLQAAAHHPEHVVIGARLKKRAQQPIHRRLANEFGDWGIAWATGYRIADTQSGQRYYPRAVCELADVTGEGFVFEADILIQAARRLHTRCVSVPIESRYAGDGLAGQFRRSHFKPLSDLYRITSHVVGRVWTYGRVIPRYIEARRSHALIYDPGACQEFLAQALPGTSSDGRTPR